MDNLDWLVTFSAFSLLLIFFGYALYVDVTNQHNYYEIHFEDGSIDYCRYVSISSLSPPRVSACISEYTIVNNSVIKFSNEKKRLSEWGVE
jgi:hypothetical protein